MGSFNETCALSNLDIPYGTPIRLLFLTENPYVHSDEHEAKRGCHHDDLWFPRTPPLKGVYDDYGRAKLEESPIIGLIEKMFQEDVVERPFGWNHCHSLTVFKGKDLQHYMEAAWEGRLLVHDQYTPKDTVPDNFPTWQKVFQLMKAAGLPLQHEEDGLKGYNAVPIIPGVVAVEFNDFYDKRLEKAYQVLEPHYDCKILKKCEDKRNPEPCLMVTVKGAYDNPSLLTNIDKIKRVLNTHPELLLHSQPRQQSVLYVMVREDVWQLFCTMPVRKNYRGEKYDIETFISGLTKSYEKASSKNPKHCFCDESFQRYSSNIPFQGTVVSHLKYAARNDFEGKDELIRACAELARVEFVMSTINKPWYIPPTGGQTSEWDIQKKLLKGMASIVTKTQKAEREQWE